MDAEEDDLGDWPTQQNAIKKSLSNNENCERRFVLVIVHIRYRA